MQPNTNFAKQFTAALYPVDQSANQLGQEESLMTLGQKAIPKQSMHTHFISLFGTGESDVKHHHAGQPLAGVDQFKAKPSLFPTIVGLQASASDQVSTNYNAREPNRNTESVPSEFQSFSTPLWLIIF